MKFEISKRYEFDHTTGKIVVDVIKHVADGYVGQVVKSHSPYWDVGQFFWIDPEVWNNSQVKIANIQKIASMIAEQIIVTTETYKSSPDGNGFKQTVWEKFINDDLISKTASRIIFAQSAQKLEQEFNRIKSKDLKLQSIKELQTALAHEMWKDGMEWEDVESVWKGKNPLYTQKKDIMNYLENTFGW